MSMKRKDINILFISGQLISSGEIKDFLSQSSSFSYKVQHRFDFFGSSDLLNESTNIDIILLDLNILDIKHQREVFRRMVSMAHGVPIIVFTDRTDHDLAVLAMEEGAMDNITKGHLGTDIFKFRDAIEYALIRKSNAEKLEAQNNDTRIEVIENAESRISDIQVRSAIDMDTQRNQYAELVMHIMETGDEDIVEAIRDIGEALAVSRHENAILYAQLEKLKKPTK